MFYLASIFLMSSIYSESGYYLREGVWEEVFVVIFAHTEEDAIIKAKAAGIEKAGASYDVNNNKIEWSFVRVERVLLLDSNILSDGLEIFSRYLKPEEAKSLLQKIELI